MWYFWFFVFGLCLGGYVVQRACKAVVDSSEALLKLRMDQREKAIDELNRATEFIDRFADGSLILSEGPCITPDGRDAYIESFSETPMARIKYEHDDDRDDEYFAAMACFPDESARIKKQAMTTADRIESLSTRLAFGAPLSKQAVVDLIDCLMDIEGWTIDDVEDGLESRIQRHLSGNDASVIK